MYLTNLPIQSITSQTFPTSKTDPSEIWLSVDSYILNLRVWTRTSQLYMMEQQPRKNIRYDFIPYEISYHPPKPHSSVSL